MKLRVITHLSINASYHRKKILETCFGNKFAKNFNYSISINSSTTTLKNVHNLRNYYLCKNLSKNGFGRNLKYSSDSKFSGQLKSSSFDQFIPVSTREVNDLLAQPPVSPADSRLLKIAIIGVPNSGKSTLINEIVGWQVCSVSKKVHTTQCSTRAVYNNGITQLVFLDTPGIVSPAEVKKYRLKHSLVEDPEISLSQADLIAVLHDVSNKYTKHTLHPGILRLLLLYSSVPSVLILNKVDLLKNKQSLLELTRVLTEGIVNKQKIEISSKYKSVFDKEAVRKSLLEPNKATDRSIARRLEVEITQNRDPNPENESHQDFHSECYGKDLCIEDVISGKVKPNEKQVQKLIEEKKGWPLFSEVFMLSALEGFGVEDCKNFLIRSAKTQKWMFNNEVVTDQNPQEIVILTVRGKCLEYLDHNIPYELKYRILYWDLSNSDVLSILVAIYCKSKSHMKLLVGPSGRKAKKIATHAEQTLRDIFRTEVRLRITFECNKNIEGSDIEIL